MRRSRFQVLADHVFGPALARTYCAETLLAPYGYVSADDALSRGENVRDVWVALCDAHDVPESERWELPEERRRAR
ncbi:DUF3046 domain-containing protein [Devriesea agamarum]|uniref:DUF3046 domain-containing protein n=1 Tax=Devriesea agamarum TaxID=472569 RepID=UPI00071E4A32|nr:DUF3046 domain-containing protein [Devriesea agamarum]